MELRGESQPSCGCLLLPCSPHVLLPQQGSQSSLPLQPGSCFGGIPLSSQSNEPQGWRGAGRQLLHFYPCSPRCCQHPNLQPKPLCGREAQNLTAVLFCSEQPMICVVFPPPQSFLSPQSDPRCPQLSYRVSDTCLPVLGSDRSPKCRL